MVIYVLYNNRSKKKEKKKKSGNKTFGRIDYFVRKFDVIKNVKFQSDRS